MIEKGENVDTPTGKTYKLSTDKTEFNLLKLGAFMASACAFLAPISNAF